MKTDYIITIDEVNQRGLLLQNYLTDSNLSSVFINIALGKVITRVLFFNDNFKYEKDIEKALDNDQDLLPAFKKLQFQAIYNLTFLGDENPMNADVDDIICSDLRWGKINGYQKHIWRK